MVHLTPQYHQMIFHLLKILKDNPLKIDLSKDVVRLNTLFFKDVEHLMDHVTIAAKITQSIGIYRVLAQVVGHPALEITPRILRGTGHIRSEERRVGKECGSRGSACRWKIKTEQ